jgi:hypothetical protein
MVIMILRCSIADPITRIRIFPSRVQGQKDLGSASKNLSIFNPKKLFVSSWKYGPGCSSRIQGSKGHPESLICNTAFLYFFVGVLDFRLQIC